MGRDIGGEIVVALGILVMIAFALMFAIILSLTGARQNTSSTTIEALTQATSVVSSSTTATMTDTRLPAMSTAVEVEDTTPTSAAQLAIQTVLPASSATLTETPTLTLTRTATFTQTATETDVPTATSTETATITLSPTVEATFTPEPSATETATLTETMSATETPEATATETSTASATFTETSEPTATESATHTPDITATDLATATESATITPPNPTETAEFTSTYTPSPTHDVTATHTPTPSETLLPTATDTELPPLLGTAVVVQVTSQPPTATPEPEVLFTPTPSLTPTIFAPISVQTGDCSVPENWLPYEVQPGNTLFAIALAVGSSVGELREVNCLQTVDRPAVGQTVYVPRIPSGLVYTTPPADTAINEAIAQGCTDPGAIITSPNAGESITGVIAITGTATVTNLNYYMLEVRPNFVESFSFYQRFDVSVRQGTLGQLNTDFFDDGLHWIRLSVVDNSGNALDTCTVPVFFR